MIWWFLQPITLIKCVRRDDPEDRQVEVNKTSAISIQTCSTSLLTRITTTPIPYIWGATAIGVNGDAVDPKSVTSWADLWKPEYKGSLLLTDDAREVFQMALRKLGYSGNTTDPKEIEAAYNELKKLMPNVAAFNSDNPANPYMEGEVNLGMIWNGSAFVARQAGTPIDVVWPKEGGIFWMDSLAIPANAKNKEGALKLINFLLRPDVAKTGC
ncbi:spermidine/putrescine ABC transporter substrate-binding protein [Escherichia coli]|uniref:Spermidine/putrescine-binding periplasmic protein n=1 Tax=Escherichia coli TaxID=562 RepID=A0A377F5G9_ECOLX|nr:spermidine/putrescine ABC transporter substrate-binding protein [Escherichia coli]